ncbi:8929_t:CDS:2 [Funneliformis geosporum]|uniref:8929_t:CDS:1 n=1 Tax=Funneliformis geosporum TaxID=1117311 RepID=A0A9W4SE98_9GLOM|nr:8929_t:CDS:2 [Funneliformis geosporum]
MDLTVQLPVHIAHSASLQPAPIAEAVLNVFPNHYNMMDELAPASPYAYILALNLRDLEVMENRNLSPPNSEYELVNTSHEPEDVKKWLEKRHNNQSETSSPALSDGKPVVTPGENLFGHILFEAKKLQQNIPFDSNGQGTTPIDIPIHDSSDSFKRNESLVSSPSGLTLLMRKKASIPTIHDKSLNIYENASNEIPKNRPRRKLPPPPTTPAPEMNCNMTDHSSINPIPDENPIPKTKMRRRLLAVLTSPQNQ